MKSAIRIAFLLLLLACSNSAHAAEAPVAPLDAYLARPEPAYQWAVAPEGQYPAVENTVDLDLTSQTWQGIPWQHRVQIVLPAADNDVSIVPDAAVIWISNGKGTPTETVLAQAITRATGALGVNLFGVPNQPLFDKTEDALIAYTFSKALETRDPTWPLLFPMTKSVIKAMDAVNDWSEKTRGKPIKRFILFGASKRGWTTYLAGAGDKRVAAIIPIVYNFLNIPVQLEYQKQIWGATSDQMDDYKGLTTHETGEHESKLLATVDPYTFRDRLTMPKLLVIATNDRYWPPDALKFYGSDLPQPWNVFYAANAQHGLNKNYVPVMYATAAFARRILIDTLPPQVSLTAKAVDGHFAFTCSLTGGKNLDSETERSGKLWYTTATTPDLRDAQWQAIPLEPGKTTFTADLPTAPGKTTYAFAELALGSPQLPIKITSLLWQSP